MAMDKRTEQRLVLYNADLKSVGKPPIDTWTAGYDKLTEEHEKLLAEKKAARDGNGNGQSEAQPVKTSSRKRAAPKKELPPKKAAAKKEAAPKKEAKKKVVAEKKAEGNMVTLKEICDDLDIEPKPARVKLRAAYGDPKQVKHLPERLGGTWVFQRNQANIKAIGNLIKPAE